MRTEYDFIIIGAGAAGLQLAHQFIQNPQFVKSSILIIDREDKIGDDHTWSFWEKGPGPYDKILWHSWEKATIYTSKGQKKNFDLFPYQYKTIRSSSFYQFMKSALAVPNVTWLKANVESVSRVNETIHVKTPESTYHARHSFDSRLPIKSNELLDQHLLILQHFKGLVIKTDQPIFDSDQFVMMDFRVQMKDHTSFFYVLPKSNREALIEFTLFDHQILEPTQYDKFLKKYLAQTLGDIKYDILDVETGVIPMTTYPFEKLNSNRITKIGTAGGWVRPSSGYGFYNAYCNAQLIVQNIAKNNSPTNGIYIATHQWFDDIFLRVLDRENHKGNQIFESIYANNNLPSVFRFLDKQSNWNDNLKMIFSVPWGPFLRALGRKLIGAK